MTSVNIQYAEVRAKGWTKNTRTSPLHLNFVATCRRNRKTSVNIQYAEVRAGGWTKSARRDGTKPGLWTLDWTMDWIMDSILDRTAK